MSRYSSRLWCATAIVCVISLFDMLVGGVCLAWSWYWFTELRETHYRGANSVELTLLFLTFQSGCVVQFVMGIKLYHASFQRDERFCERYVKVTLFCMFVSFPFLFRAIEMIFVLIYLHTLTSYKEYQKRKQMSLLSIENQDEADANIELSENSDFIYTRRETTHADQDREVSEDAVRLVHHMFLEEHRTNDGRAQVHLYQESSFNYRDNSGSEGLDNIPNMIVVHPEQSIVSNSANNLPPDYSVCVSKFEIQRGQSAEDEPPSYDLAIKTLDMQ